VTSSKARSIRRGSLKRELGAELLSVKSEGECLLLPPPHEVRREGRTLRGEEYASYARACEAAASRLAPRALRLSIEEMYLFDWDAFRKQEWAALSAAYESLPGWIGAEELPRWFGMDERKGPFLWASVEPPGLQVGGILELAAFEDWHRRFLQATAGLPVRSPGW
jgi:hypothetical protein